MAIRPARLDSGVRLLVNLYLPSAFVSMSQGLVVPTIPTLATAFAVPAALAAQVVTALLLGRALMTIPSGMIVDRLGRKPAMILGPIMLIGGSLLAASAGSFPPLLAGQFLGGAGVALWQLGREVAAVDLIKPEVRGRMLSLFFGLQSAGQALGPLAGGFVTERWGFRTVFWGGLVIGLIVLGMTARLPETRTHRPPPKQRLLEFGRLSDLPQRYRGTYVVLIFATFAAGMRNSVVSAILPLHAEGRFGLSTTEVGALFAVMGGVTLVAMGPAGWISDRIGRKAATVPAAILAGVAFLSYPFASSLPAMIAVSAIVGIASGFALGAMTVYTYDIAPAAARGRLQALRRTMNELGGVAGPALAGAVVSVSNTGLSFLALAPIHLISAATLAIGARETAGKYRGLVSVDEEPAS
jgi:DHA1 family multidrug resistance protein-like MFS transporter